MKRALTLLAVAMVTASSVGCNCCPCLRGLCCWPTSNPCAPAPTYAAAPACPPPPAPLCAAPTCAPVQAPVYAMPQQYTVPQYAAPQYAAPQYAVAAPTTPMFTEAACGMPYMTEMGCGCPTTGCDPGCGYMGGYGGPSQQMMMDPGPAGP